MIHPLKITSTLADETRFLIYEFMLKTKKSFSVNEIAEQFSIHPNVARLHLTKLTEVKCVTASFVKTGKGGRPGRFYKANEAGIELSFPRRDYSFLLHLLIETITELGEPAIQKGKQISYSHGQNTIYEIYPKPELLSLEERIKLLQDQVALIGYIAHVQNENDQLKIMLNIHSCPFHTYLPNYSDMICAIHESYLQGMTNALFETVKCEQTLSMLHNCSECKYSIEV